MANFNIVGPDGFQYFAMFGDFGNPDNFFNNFTGITNKTAAQFIVKAGPGEPTILAKGAGIAYDPDGNAIDGTITSLTIKIGNATIVNYTGLSLDAGDFQLAVENAVAQNNESDFRAMFISPAMNINASNADDDLRTGNGNDNILLKGGDDYIELAGGRDTIDGGDGYDFLSYRWFEGFRGIDADLAAGTVIDQFGDTDTILNVEEIEGTRLNDRIAGTNGDDYFRSMDEGRDRYNGRGGLDFDFVNYDSDRGNQGIVVDLAAGFAIDTFGFRDILIDIEEIGGTRFGDRITGNGEDNFFEPGEGVDTVNGGGGFDTVNYGNRNNGTGITANLATGKVIDQFGDTDNISNIESVFGTNSDDSFTGNGVGNQFRGNDGADTYAGGGGNDEVRYDREDGGAGIVANLATGAGTDTWGNDETYSNIERVRGSQYADNLTGNSQDNRFRGLGGDDTMNGGTGSDQADYSNDANRGGNGAVTVNLATGIATDGFGDTDTLISIEEAGGTAKGDTLIGSAVANWLGGGDGNDTLTGGGGADIFWFDGALGAGNVDRIVDYNVAADTIHLWQGTFSELSEGDLANNQFFKAAGAAAATTVNHRIIYSTTTGQLFYDADGDTVGGVAQVLFATLTGSPDTLSAADFDIFS